MDVKVIREYFDRELGRTFSPGAVIRELKPDRAQKLIKKKLVEAIPTKEKADKKIKVLEAEKA